MPLSKRHVTGSMHVPENLESAWITEIMFKSLKVMENRCDIIKHYIL